LFGKKEERKLSFEEKLEDLGVSVIADQQLAERKAIIEEVSRLIRMPEDKFLEWLEKQQGVKYDPTPENFVYALMTKLHGLNYVIALAAEPYARAGDNPQFAKMLKAWHTIYWWSYELCLSQLQMMEKVKTGYKYIIYFQLRSFLKIHVFPRGETVMGLCYRNIDVAPSRAVIIQQFTQGIERIIERGKEGDLTPEEGGS